MTTTEKTKGCTPARVAAPTTTKRDISWNSTKSQCARLLAALKTRPMTTLEIRRDLDILGVGPRIFDLRHKHGMSIVTSWIDELTSDGGMLHRVARYVLMPDPQTELFDGANGGAA